MEKLTENRVILVVEDEVPLQEAIKIKLEKSNFSVVTSRTVNQALDYLSDLKKVDVIWLDHYLLGKENGLDFVSRVKVNNAWHKIPIFIVSNTASAEKVQTYLRLGISRYYAKSDYRLDQIISDIREYLDKIE